VEVEAGNQYEVGERFDELHVVGMSSKAKCKSCTPDLHDDLGVRTRPLIHPRKFDSKLMDDRKARNYGKSFIYQDPNHFPGHIYL